MRVKVEVSQRRLVEVDVPEARVGEVRKFASPVSLENFEEVAGVKVDWDDSCASSGTTVQKVIFSGVALPGSELPPVLSVELVMRAVVTHYDGKLADLKGSSRLQVTARRLMVAMYLARKLTGTSFPEIGRCFGGKDHSTVFHAVKTIERLLPGDSALREAVEAIERSLVKATEDST